MLVDFLFILHAIKAHKALLVFNLCHANTISKCQSVNFKETNVKVNAFKSFRNIISYHTQDTTNTFFIFYLIV